MILHYSKCASIKFNVSVPFKERIKEQARKEGIKDSALMRKAIHRYLVGVGG